MADSKQHQGSNKNSSGFLAVGIKIFIGLLICFVGAKFFFNDPPELDTPTRPSASGEQGPLRATQVRPNRSDPKPLLSSVEPMDVSRTDEQDATEFDADTGDVDGKAIAERDPFVYELSRAGIDGAMRTIRDGIQRCYERGVVDEDLTEGWSKFKFKIEKRVDDPDNADIAQITEVSVKDTTLDSEQVQECVMQLIDELWFDPPEDGVIYVEYPIYFEDEPED